jgi:hypothetical protein
MLVPQIAPGLSARYGTSDHDKEPAQAVLPETQSSEDKSAQQKNIEVDVAQFVQDAVEAKCSEVIQKLEEQKKELEEQKKQLNGELAAALSQCRKENSEQKATEDVQELKQPYGELAAALSQCRKENSELKANARATAAKAQQHKTLLCVEMFAYFIWFVVGCIIFYNVRLSPPLSTTTSCACNIPPPSTKALVVEEEISTFTTDVMNAIGDRMNAIGDHVVRVMNAVGTRTTNLVAAGNKFEPHGATTAITFPIQLN